MIWSPKETKGHAPIAKQTILSIDTGIGQAAVMNWHIVKSGLDIHCRENGRLPQLVAEHSLIWYRVVVLPGMGIKRDEVDTQAIILSRLLYFYQNQLVRTLNGGAALDHSASFKRRQLLSHPGLFFRWERECSLLE